MGGLTSTQREALEWLKAKRDATHRDRWPHGFNPPTGNARLTASMRRSLAERGYVEVTRISESHFRYEITESGCRALDLPTPSAQESER